MIAGCVPRQWWSRQGKAILRFGLMAAERYCGRLAAAAEQELRNPSFVFSFFVELGLFFPQRNSFLFCVVRLKIKISNLYSSSSLKFRRRYCSFPNIFEETTGDKARGQRSTFRGKNHRGRETKVGRIRTTKHRKRR